MLDGARVFITGGAGFIGSWLAELLLPRNLVTLFDTLERDAASGASFTDSTHLTTIKGDVLDSNSLRAAMTGHDHVIHCAAIAGIDTVVRRPVRTLEVNVLGSFAVLEAAVQMTGVERVVCFSTSEIFGPQAGGAKESDSAVIGPAGEPRWTYAVGKLVEEHAAIAYHRQTGLPAVVLRPFNVYGPRQIGEGAINNFTRLAVKGQKLIVRGSGEQVRAWTYITDMVEGVMLALTHKEAVGQDFNIGNPHTALATRALAELVNEIAGNDAGIEHVAGSSAEIENRWPDVSKARLMLGFEPTVGLEEGITATIDHLRSQLVP